MESMLWAGLNLDKDGHFPSRRSDAEILQRPLLVQQTHLYNNLYKPTYSFRKTVGRRERADRKVAQGAQPRDQGADREGLRGFLRHHFMAKTYEKLGWKIPAQAPFLPANLERKKASFPDPAYANANTLKPQPWPGPGHLTKPLQVWCKTYNP